MVWSTAMFAGEGGKEGEGRIAVGKVVDMQLAMERRAGVAVGRWLGAKVGTKRDNVH